MYVDVSGVRSEAVLHIDFSAALPEEKIRLLSKGDYLEIGTRRANGDRDLIVVRFPPYLDFPLASFSLAPY